MFLARVEMEFLNYISPQKPLKPLKHKASCSFKLKKDMALYKMRYSTREYSPLGLNLSGLSAPRVEGTGEKQPRRQSCLTYIKHSGNAHFNVNSNMLLFVKFGFKLQVFRTYMWESLRP